MAPDPIFKRDFGKTSTVKQEKAFGISTPLLFGAIVAFLTASYDWPRRWVLSGTPVLMFCILLGASNGYRILPFFHLWSLLATLNLVYTIAATSWLLYGVFTATCFPAVFLASLFQFDTVADLVRRQMRSLLNSLQFVNDKIAFFDIPALEIDTEVDGLMVIRGLSISLSTLTIVAHGVEVGIKLSDDLELSICTEKVTIPLFRRIHVEDCFANIKGGEYEMTFGSLEKTENVDDDAIMLEDTPLLKIASEHSGSSRPPTIKLTSKMTDGQELKNSSAEKSLSSVVQISLDDKGAWAQYQSTLKWITDTNLIHECRERIEKLAKEASSPDETVFDPRNHRDMRAAICSQLHNLPSVPHPSRRSIKVTTLQNLSSPRVRQFLHRLPMLLRLLLNPLSYFHPVYIDSITATGSGKWITHVLQEKIFKDYADENSELQRLQERLYSWLSDANFAFELADIKGLAQVPFQPLFDIVCLIELGDVMAYRTLPSEVQLKQVIRLGGADATFTVPSFLLPHHEHLLPPIPNAEDKKKLKQTIEDADGKPEAVQRQHDLDQAEKDEANVKISAHAKLPACFDQELLDFIAALVKATKLVELEKEPNAMDQEVKRLKDFTHSLHQGMKDHMKKVVVDGVINDKVSKTSPIVVAELRS
jgi:hypothetical protein